MGDELTFLQNAKVAEFSKIPNMARTWQGVLSQGSRIERAKGCELLGCGRIWNVLYYLEVGEVHLTRTLPDGRERLLWISTPPCIIGEGPFFDQLPASSSFIVKKPSVFYAFSHDWVMNTLLPKYPELTLTLLQGMSSKLRMINNQSVCLSMEDISMRICKFLYSKLKIDKTSAIHSIEPGLSQQELANLLGVHRVTLNKTLRALEKQGILSRYQKKEIYILNIKIFLDLVG